METLIRQYCINCVWHFTDESNLDSIKEHGGLFSLRELENRDIEIPRPGGNDWSHDADRNKGMDDFVHLTFCNTHPMLHIAIEEGRIKNPFWLKVDKTIITDPDVRFTPDVSNKRGVEIINHDAAKQEIDFEVIYTRMNWSDPDIQERRQAGEKAEILVPKHVPLDRILNI